MINKNLILLLIFICFFVSCNKVENIPTISFWHFNSEPEQRNALDEIIKEFEQEFKCKVNLTELSWNDGKIKLVAAFNSETAPDALELGSDWIAQFSSSGVLYKLNKSYKEQFLDFTLMPAIWNNTLYCLPWYVDTRVYYYNKKLTNGELPYNISWDEMMNIACKVNSHNYHGIGVNGADPHRLYKKIISTIWSSGGDIVDEKGNLKLNHQNNITAIEKYCNSLDCGIMEKQKNLDQMFLQGKIAFLNSGGWMIDKLLEAKNLDFGVIATPGINNNKGISFTGGEYLAVSKQSKNKKLAIELIRYISKGENSIKFCKKVPSAGFPADKKFYKNEFYNSQPIRLLFARQLESSKMTPIQPKWLEIEEILEQAVEKVLYKKTTAKKALDEAQKKAIELINES